MLVAFWLGRSSSEMVMRGWPFGTFDTTKADIRHGGEMACYRPSGDFIQMPDEWRFRNADTRTEDYYSILGHELAHWTAPANRCDRQLGKRFGDDAYAVE